MIAGLKPYPARKDSGVPWIGEVPEHWDLRRLGQLGRLWKGNGGTKADEVESGIPCVRYGDLYTKHEFFIRNSKAYVTPERAAGYTRIRHGDVLFAASGETIDDIGRSAVSLVDGRACCGGDILILRPQVPVTSEFLGYAADSVPSRRQKAQMGRGFTVVHIYGSQLKRMVLALPPLPEQAAIVRFLDYANRRISRYIRAKQQLIKLLEEDRRAIINHAVTRGLDPGVALQPSGVDWLGDLPAHWEVVRSRRLFSVRKELARPDDVQLSASQQYGVIPQSEFERKVGRKVVRISMHLDKRRHVEKDDFVISMRSFQGGLERAWSSGCIRSSYVVLKPGHEVDVGFFSYLFKSHDYVRALQATANFIRDGQDLTYGNFSLVDLPLPPLAEQKTIAASIDSVVANIETYIDRTRVEVDCLHEYRTRLIADVITGKLDVQEAAAGLPDELEEPESITDSDELSDAEDTSDPVDAVFEEVEV